MSLNSVKPPCSVVAELVNYMNERSSSRIVSFLTRIKTDQKRKQKLLSNGGVALLVKLLRFENGKVLDITLSVLANLCLLQSVRNEVEGTEIAAYVVWILKNLHAGQTIHCRACRLIANLSESIIHAKVLCEMGAVNILTEILRSRTDAQTYSMAVRAVKNIWNTYKDSREKILEAGTITAITSLLVYSRKKLMDRENDAKYMELGESCLKAMHVFVDDKDPRSGEQMRGEKDLHGYRCIVEYCRANNKTAITCLYKLSCTAKRRPDLGSSGAIDFLLEAVKAGPLLTNATSTGRKIDTSFWECLLSLCLFCREAVNRAKIRSGSGLEVILSLLNEAHYERYHPALLHALTEFKWEHSNIVIMVENGLIDVLVKKLKQMVSEVRPVKQRMLIRKSINAKKRSADTLPDRRGSDVKCNRRNEMGRFSFDYPEDVWSMGRNGTPPLSPEVDENADGNYSPLCSDNKWAENEDDADEKDDKDKFPEDYMMEKIMNNAFEDKPTVDDVVMVSTTAEDCRERGSHVYTLALLSILSYSSETFHDLAEPKIIQPLVAYIDFAKDNLASEILTRIIRKRAFFCHLLLQGFVFQAQTLYGTKHYTTALSEIAETGGAFGEMSMILSRGSLMQKLKVALSIPFLVKNREYLRVLLHNKNGIELIFSVLKDPESTLHGQSVHAICQLADTLDLTVSEGIIERPKTPELINNGNNTNDRRVDGKHLSTNLRSRRVTFELDDGNRVYANRLTLCKKSEVFAAMLEGHFYESGLINVPLKNVSYGGLNTLLTVTHGQSVHRDYKIEALLDATVLAEKYLMLEEWKYLSEIAIARLSYENLCHAWNWSRANANDDLQTWCVKLLLTGPMTRVQRLCAFRDFTKANMFNELIEDVRKIIANEFPTR